MNRGAYFQHEGLFEEYVAKDYDKISEGYRTHVKEYPYFTHYGLSGSQQQRVVLARALVINPDVLLMDEPLSNLFVAFFIGQTNIIDAHLKVENKQTFLVFENGYSLELNNIRPDYQYNQKVIKDHNNRVYGVKLSPMLRYKI